MNINEVAEITGISVRTLHHYDAIAILSPLRNSENGYREYSNEDLDKLQQILFFKECGFKLSKIKELLDNPAFDRALAFELQKKYLLHEKERIDSMLKTLELSIKSMKGEAIMGQKEKFSGFDFTNNPYEEEARSLWGDEAVDKSNAYISSISQGGQKDISKNFDALFKELSKLMCFAPESQPVQDAMSEMLGFFNSNFGHQYTPEAFGNLGQMYVEDKRFTENIDKYGKGLAEFLAKAMKIYADDKKRHSRFS